MCCETQQTSVAIFFTFFVILFFIAAVYLIIYTFVLTTITLLNTRVSKIMFCSKFILLNTLILF
mgnify:CR=1 FL=1